jgi:predicted O-methyltransferase YrrM
MNQLSKKIIRRVFNAFGLEISCATPAASNKKTLPPNTLQSKTEEEFFENIDSQFRTALLSMYCGEPQLGIDGKPHSVDQTTRISLQQGIWLYELCLAVKPKSTLEIGLAYGFSTLYFLAAATKNQGSFHTAIDPNQYSSWHGIGLTHANALAPRRETNSSFRFIEDSSERAATDLARANCKYDLIFVDGNHRFDNVLVDFYLYAQLCTIGGYIIFDDVWLSSVSTVIDFVRTNRTDFIEIHSTEPNIMVFQKKRDDKRKWNDFHEFKVTPPSVDIT